MAKPKFSGLERLLVRWTPIASTSGFMFHAVSNADQTQALVSAAGTIFAALWASYSEGIMTEAEQRLNQLGQEHTQKFFGLVEVIAIKTQERLIRLKWRLMDDFQGQYYNRLDVTCQFLKTGGISLDKRLRLQKVFVPVNLSPEDLSRFCTNRLLEPDPSKSAEVLERELRNPNQLGDYLELMCTDPRFSRLAILGAPGSGKTTLMRHLTLMYALRQPQALHAKAPQLLPVLLPLRNIYEEILTKSKITLPELITQYIENLTLSKPLTVPQGWFAEQLRRNRCLILLDGFDEVAEAQHRKTVSHWVDQQMAAWPKTPFILTSRPKGYQEAPLPRTEPLLLKVKPFNSEQIEQFVRNWYQEVESVNFPHQADVAAQVAHEQIVKLLKEIKHDPNLKRLAANPLLLTLITKVHQQNESLPRQRVELYHLICEVLLGKRQAAKDLISQFSIAEKRSILEPLALELMQRKTKTFRFEDVTAFLQEQLAKFPDPPTPQAFLKQLEDVDALIAKEREGDYEFAHLSFQEYLAAARVKETKDNTVFLQALQDPENLSWWAETMKLYAAQTDAGRLVNAVLQQEPEPALAAVLLAWKFCQQGIVEQAQRQALAAFSARPLNVLEPTDLQHAQDVQPRYLPLAHYLQTGQWKAADRETFNVMSRIMGGWSISNIKKFPCEDLRVIDQLWLKYSQGKFGFSIQKQIWVEVGGLLDYGEDLASTQAAWSKLYKVVNWSTIRYELASPRGHLPALSVDLSINSFSLFSRIQVCRL